MSTPVIERQSDAIPFFSDPRLSAMSFGWSLEKGKPAQIIVVKATCDIDASTGAVTLRDEANAPSGDVHVGDSPLSTLRYPSDIAVIKGHCDVVLWGHAYANGKPRVEVRFSFGDSEKGGFDRALRVDGAPSKNGPAAFERLPLVWELAAHHETDNPAGRRASAGSPAQITSEDGAPGFAAIPMMWPKRLERFGTYDASWYEERFPYFAEDFHPDAFQVAPVEQRLDVIRGDERFSVMGLHATKREITGALPGLHPRVHAVGPSPDGGTFQEVQLRLDTVVFDFEALTIELVWRGTHAVGDERASDVTAWFGQLDGVPNEDAAAATDAGPAREESETREAFLRLYAPSRDAEDASTPQSAVSVRDAAMARHEARARERLVAAGMAPELLDPSTAAPAAPPPREWQAADDDPVRKAVSAWLAGGSAPAPNLAGAELSGLDFSGRDMAGWILRGAHLAKCSFHGCNLEGAELGEADAESADFGKAKLDGADLTGAILTGATFDKASLTDTDLTRCVADGVSFVEARAPSASWSDATLQGANFAGAILDDASFTESRLAEANFERASMKATRLYDADATNATFAGADLTGARADGMVLSGANIKQATAEGAVFDGADLTKSQWGKTRMRGVSLVSVTAHAAALVGVDMRGARLRAASLRGADLRASDLMEADLTESDLEDADVRGASLFGADLFGANLDNLNREGANLGRTILDS